MLILDRFHFSSAVVTPVKYDHHSNYLTGSFAKKVWQEKLTNAGFSNPHPRFIAENFLGICCRHRLWLLWLLNHYVVLIGQVFAKHSGGINHIEAETKWPAFCRQHFPTYFLEWKLLYFYSNFSEICSKGPINNRPALWKWISTEVATCHYPNQWWSCYVYWCIYGSLSLEKFQPGEEPLQYRKFVGMYVIWGHDGITDEFLSQ